MSEIEQQQQAEQPQATEFDAAFAEFATQAAEQPLVDDPQALAPDPAAAADPPQEDPWASAPEPLRAEREALRQQAEQLRREATDWQHRYTSDAGRVSALQRQINALQEQIRAGAQSQTSPQQQGPAAPGTAGGDKWARLREDYPEIAEAIETRLHGELEARLAPLAAPIQQLQVVEQQRSTERAIGVLAQEHPDYQDIARSPDLAAWLDRQPQAVQQMARATQDPRELAWVFRAFKAERAPQAAAAPPQQAPAQPGAGSVQQQRRERLAASAGVQSTAATAGSRPIPKDDFDAAFAHYASRRASR